MVNDIDFLRQKQGAVLMLQFSFEQLKFNVSIFSMYDIVFCW